MRAIGGKPVEVERYEDERARRLAGREFHLTWAADLPHELEDRSLGFHATLDERLRESAVLRTLGVIAGLLAAVGASGIGFLLAPINPGGRATLAKTYSTHSCS